VRHMPSPVGFFKGLEHTQPGKCPIDPLGKAKSVCCVPLKVNNNFKVIVKDPGKSIATLLTTAQPYSFNIMK